MLGENRKRLLLIIAYTGAVACMLFIFIVPSIYLLGCLLVVIGVTCLGSSFVLLNSFLPILVSNHPSIENENGGTGDEGEMPMATLSSDNDDTDSLDFEDTTKTAF